MQERATKIKESDAIVLLPSEYNSVIPPALTNMLCHFSPSLFTCKPSGIVTYSLGVFGGMRVTMQLRVLHGMFKHWQHFLYTRVCSVVADVDDGENLTIADVDEAEIAEEIVVTVDVTTSNEDVTHTSDSLNDSLATIQTTVTVPGGQVVTEDITESDRPSSAFVFKDSNFVHSSKGIAGNKRTRVWKNLKQIVAAERALQWGPDDVTYGSIDAPPSFRPAKKYSDISGLEAKYTDPRTKMRYANSDEYRRVHLLPNDIITGCLQLRKANTLMP
ncbi:uncharacterized protein LOC131952904 [Physella acuta]|uniref:uncharacterized protein LOC131952904 n=1 Tax=Physella acuta TaxID=109671 RepID=UPI0027DDF0DE|nr:uncharacterized protein LOC131952904 [Physella acuta]